MLSDEVPLTDHELAQVAYGLTGKVKAQVARKVGIPLDVIREVLRRPEYGFRNQLYRTNLVAFLETELPTHTFGPIIRGYDIELSRLVDEATTTRDKTMLAAHIRLVWPLLRRLAPERGDGRLGWSYLKARYMLVAAMQNVELVGEQGKRADWVEAALNAIKALRNTVVTLPPAEVLREVGRDDVLEKRELKTAAAYVLDRLEGKLARMEAAGRVLEVYYRTGRWCSLNKKLDYAELKTLVWHSIRDMRRYRHLETDVRLKVAARNVVHAVSAWGALDILPTHIESVKHIHICETLCRIGRSVLISRWKEFESIDHHEWSGPGISPADDPDLHFYRSVNFEGGSHEYRVAK